MNMLYYAINSQEIEEISFLSGTKNFTNTSILSTTAKFSKVVHMSLPF